MTNVSQSPIQRNAVLPTLAKATRLAKIRTFMVDKERLAVSKDGLTYFKLVRGTNGYMRNWERAQKPRPVGEDLNQ